MANSDAREGVLYKFGKKGRCRAVVARGDLPSVSISPVRGFPSRDEAEEDARITARILNETYRDPGRQTSPSMDPRAVDPGPDPTPHHPDGDRHDPPGRTAFGPAALIII